MIQYIIAAGIGAFLGSRSKKSKKSYAHGGEVGKTYSIQGVDVTYYEDSYEEGELDQFHSYYLGQSDFPYKTEFSSKKDLFDTLNEFISYGDFSESDFFVDEDTIQTSALVKFEKDSDWDEFSAPTEKEKELWRKGKMKLYSALFVFPYEVYKKEKLDFAKGGEVSKRVARLLVSLDKAFKDKDFDKFNSISNEIHSISDNEGLSKEEYDKWDLIREKETKYQIENFGFAKGGEVDDLEYSEIYDVLKDKIDDAVEDISSTYDQADNAQGEEVESKSRDGFIPYTNGGYSSKWFEYINMLSGSGTSLPTSVLDKEMQRQVDYSYELAKDRFVEENEELVKEIGEDKVNYHDLYELGYGDEAESLSEMEMYTSDDSIMMVVEALYYNPENDRATDGKHTIGLSGVVNLESPYHRTGNLEDFIEEKFTFNSVEELETKMDSNLKKVIGWFEGDNYSESKRELKIRRMAKGGSIKVGDRVKYPKAKNSGKVKSIRDLGSERELTIEYDDGKIIKDGESSVFKDVWFAYYEGVGKEYSPSEIATFIRFLDNTTTERTQKDDYYLYKHPSVKGRWLTVGELLEIWEVKKKTYTWEKGGMVDKKVIDHTNKKIKGWYKNAKQDHGVVGRGKTSIKDDEIIVDYVENGKKKSWSMAYYPSYVDDNGLDYFYNVWMEQA